jgi:hypothetical protein
MDDQIAKTVQHIHVAFPRTPAPLEEWETCMSVEDFIEKFGDDFFTEFWTAIYNNFAITRFLFPVVLECFLLDEKSRESCFELNLLLGRFDPEVQKHTQSEYDVYTLFERFDGEQRKVLCEWMDLIEKKYGDLLDLDGARNYWCSEHHKPGAALPQVVA